MSDNESQQSPLTTVSEKAPEVYERILETVYLSIENLEQQSWPFIQDKIREAAEIELSAEEMTREEVDLLQAYLQRDLSDLGYFIHKTGEGIAAWLKFDLNILELKLATSLKGIADKTRLDQTYLEQRLAHGPEEYVAGEVAMVGSLRCLNCGCLTTLTETTVIEPCEDCGSRYFHRDSKQPATSLDE